MTGIELRFLRLPNASREGLLVSDASPLGYVAEELLMSGYAGVRSPSAIFDSFQAYNDRFDPNIPRIEMEPGGTSPNPVQRVAPFTARVLVYRPADVSRFSGNVIFEVIHPVNNGHVEIWSCINKYYAARGDIAVAVQHPFSVKDLHTANAKRYGAVHFDDATQMWDVIAQLATTIRDRRPAPQASPGDALDIEPGHSPLPVPVRRMYGTGYSFTSSIIDWYARYFHDTYRREDGGQLIDGYLPMTGWTHWTPRDVPVIHCSTQSDYFGYTDNTPFNPSDREGHDSDLPHRRSRYYEVPGSFHVPLPPHQLGSAWTIEHSSPFLAECRSYFPPDMGYPDMPIRAIWEGMFRNISDWVERGIAPPRAPLIETAPDWIKGRGARYDEDGNAVGGLRLPDMQVPWATWDNGHPSQGGSQATGYRRPFSQDRMRELYGDRISFLQRYDAATEGMSRDRWIVESAVEELKTRIRSVVLDF